MNNFFKIIFLFTLGLAVVSCSKNDSGTEPLRDYADQYTKDIANIETFMHTHYMEVNTTAGPGVTEDQDVSFHLIDAGQISIWDQTDYPIRTRFVTIQQDNVDVTYKIYYIPLRGEIDRSTASAADIEKAPSNVDRVFAAYRGEYIYSSTVTEGTPPVSTTTIKSTEFESLDNPQTYFNLTGVIRGWSEIFPQFKAGTYTGNPDGTTSYFDFGAGIMFLPSGLAYYNGATSGIPAYSPLIFTFKLYEIGRMDQDADGIYSYQEDLNHDGYVYTLPEGDANPDNTNGPGTKVQLSVDPIKWSKENEVPDFLDGDDDGDYFTTRGETSYVHPSDPQETIRYYPYQGVTSDDPLTLYIDETKGVPRMFTGPNNAFGLPTSNDPADFTDPARVRRYLDVMARPKFSDQKQD